MKNPISFLVSFILVFSFLNLEAEESFIPDPPSLTAKNYLLIDAYTNKVLAELNAEEIAKKAIKVASEICVFTNNNLQIEKI